MKIKGTSCFQDPGKATEFLEDWATQVQRLNSSWYETMIIHTSLGKTRVWAYNTEDEDKEAVVIFPGFRTSSLFWDFDNNLASLKKKYRLYLVETNGQPNLSEGKSPDNKTLGYGIWATEVFNQLSIKKATIIGASFGAIVCMKLCLVSPLMVNKAILMNPAGMGFSPFSAKSIYYNILLIVLKTRNSVKKVINKIILNPPHHILSAPYMQLLNEYILFTIKNFKNRANYPQSLKKHELNQIKPGIIIMLSGCHRLFSRKNIIAIANEHIRTIMDIQVFDDVGNGIEMSKEAISYIERVLEESSVITTYDKQITAF